jgi:protein-disulfide isomerase
VAVVQGGGGDGLEKTLSGPIPAHTAPAEGTTLGSPDAPVTIYEYSDFQCPFCAKAAAETVPQLDTDYLANGKAKLIFKAVRFLGDESKWAAEAALCANDQGKFWEYHNKLFEEQAGENKGTFKIENLKLFAGQIGLNQGDFDTCLDENKYETQVADNTSEATQRGVNSSPTFVVGQTQVGSKYDAISKAIEAILNPPTPSPTPAPSPEATPGG